MPGPNAALLRKKRRDLLDAAGRHGACNVRAFGSIARGQDTEASDVDLLIDLKPGHTLVDLIAFRQDAEQLLGRPVDVTTPDMLKDKIRDRVLADALPL